MWSSVDKWGWTLSLGPSKSSQHHIEWGGGKCSYHGSLGAPQEAGGGGRVSPRSTDLLVHCTDLLWRKDGPGNIYQHKEEASAGFQVSQDSYFN